jgi:hypothetical protein
MIVIIALSNILLGLALIVQAHRMDLLDAKLKALTAFTVDSVQFLNMTYTRQAIQSEQVRIYDGENVTLFDPSKRKH